MNKDLDWSDVEADAARMEAMQELLPEAKQVLEAVGVEADITGWSWTGDWGWTNDAGDLDPDGEELWFKFMSADQRDVFWARLDDGSYYMLGEDEWDGQS